jgi:heavy metal efflux system protein
MLDSIIQFSIKNRLIIGLFTLALVGWGTYSLTKIPIDAVPDITDNQVMVITVSPTLAAQEVEQLVTFPVEQTMVTIPGIQDMRSFSRFGLSIVTIVFEERIDIYWARQQVQERLSIAAKEIPGGVGEPEMAPVTTGLGEIYQYVVHAEEEYESKYDATDLRTIQDWIIKRQLLGMPGVAEVSGFGGFVKQYEIAVDPDELRSFNLAISDIFTALNKNNQNTGGAYIDKNPNAYFIRSEGLVKNLDELRNIVVRSTDKGTPILVRDVANVRFGHSVRYGAATRNGKGEVITGIVMMLKGANSSRVISNVKAKIEEIKKTLPKGVTIEPFLDRKKLVDSAITTVVRNLAEGALIVIFVLILFLGNLRGGLIVASVIPLSMLFAIAMMNLFGVSGNLMSLGAIDFGLIVDGAVIIVEAVMHRITRSDATSVDKLSRRQMDGEVHESARKMMGSAAFGQIIILIVYLPIWALVGVEGKMFRPMAETVSFAIFGAFLLSLTYVPMMSAFALSRRTQHKINFSDRMMAFFQRTYRPVIQSALRQKLPVLITAVALFVAAFIAFSQMGGEFIPQLDEGDFAVETRVPVGSSIQQMIAVSKKAQAILLREYPEVNQIVNKIGSGEIPTDPMPIEAGDMMVILKPRSEWTSAHSREELMEKMHQTLSVIPNATFSFQQPIQMRFNELLTGAKQDVVLKIYGEDLDILSDLATDVGRKIRSIEGVEDLYVEQVTGLPQIQIQFNRDKIAQYAMNIEEINTAIQTAFAGKSAGLVYEGERRFDLVVRLDSAHRIDINDVDDLYVSTPGGMQVPLREVANVSYKPGPVQIQRDNARRRITLGFNVRNRDVQSIVNDIHRVMDTQVQMPPGYFVTYGGQFKNLVEAIQRLSVAVPVALLLILLLLYFTFGSIKQSLLVFSGIPLSAIGGVAALLIRGMPFSISAGIGFIALFGVSVLNGIVLIAEFNRLRKEGVDDIRERVLRGTRSRLRPVLMTASVASLGFLPMAVSNSSGAEVQRPLATVVIGGLITSTLLTLVVLPVLYIYFTRGYRKTGIKVASVAPMAALLVSMLLPVFQLKAQENPEIRTITLQKAIDEAIQNNQSIRIGAFETSKQQALKRGAVTIPKTDLYYSQGVVSTPTIDDNLITIAQRIDFPSLYYNQSRLAKARISSSEQYQAVRENELIAEVRAAYLQYTYAIEKKRLYLRQDSIYSGLATANLRRYESGESTKLESVTSSVQALQIKNKIQQSIADVEIAKHQLQTLLNTNDEVVVSDSTMVRDSLIIGTLTIDQNPTLMYLNRELNVSQQQIKVERNRILPDLILSYSAQTYKGSHNIDGQMNTFSGNDRFYFWQVGLGIPLFPGGYRSGISAARTDEEIATLQADLAKKKLEGELRKNLLEYKKLQGALDYYEKEALPQAKSIMQSSRRSYDSGEVSYIEHLQNLTLALSIHAEYLYNLYRYNLLAITIKSLLDIK